MAKTLASSSTLLCPASEFLKRVDRNSVGQLASDTGVPIPDAQLEAHANVVAVLRDASGDVEAAALVGEKYTSADLALIAATDCNARGKLYRIVSDLAWVYLYERRPNKNEPEPPSLRRSLLWLDQLSQGRAVFALAETLDAGHLTHETTTAAEIEERRGAVVQAARYFGRRADRNGS